MWKSFGDGGFFAACGKQQKQQDCDRHNSAKNTVHRNSSTERQGSILQYTMSVTNRQGRREGSENPCAAVAFAAENGIIDIVSKNIKTAAVRELRQGDGRIEFHENV